MIRRIRKHDTEGASPFHFRFQWSRRLEYREFLPQNRRNANTFLFSASSAGIVEAFSRITREPLERILMLERHIVQSSLDWQRFREIWRESEPKE